MNFYCAFFHLNAEESETFGEIFREGPHLEAVIEKSTHHWLEHLKPVWDERNCRHMFCANAVVRVSRLAVTLGFSPQLVQAIALSLTDLVEERVNQEDDAHWR